MKGRQRAAYRSLVNEVLDNAVKRLFFTLEEQDVPYYVFAAPIKKIKNMLEVQ